MGATKEVVVVTGVHGLIGTEIQQALKSRYDVIGFDKEMDAEPPPEIECVTVDLTSDASVAHGLDRVFHGYGNRIASVVHLAAYYNFEGEPSPLYDEVTVNGTRRLLHKLQDFEVEQFLFSSTLLIHAPSAPGTLIDEDSPVDPKWDYPQSKVETERVIHAERGDVPVVIMRIAGVYTDVCDSIPIAQQIRRIFERRLTAYLFPGSTSHGQPFIHIDDLVDAMVRAVDRRRALRPEETLLIGEPETYAYDTLQRVIARQLHDEDWETEEIPKALAKSGAWMQDKIPGMEDPFIKPWMIDMADDHYELNINRARTVLEWEPKHRLTTTVPRMCDALLDDPAAWYSRHGFATDSIPSTAHSRASSR